MTPQETALEFVRRINSHDVDAIAKLMAKGHRFVDSHGHTFVERREMKRGWKQYFEWFPDYEIIIGEAFPQGNIVALFGAASASFHSSPKRRWRIPSAWLAVIEGGKILEWHVFADTKIPFDSMGT